MVFRLLLPHQIHAALLEHARAELPNECCGLLAGRKDSGIGRVERCYPLVNALASPVEYESEPRGMFEAERDMRRRGIEVLAVYHSHPTTAPLPSRQDMERSYSPNVVNLIVSLKEKEPAVRAWWLSPGSCFEAQWELQEAGELPGTVAGE
jgi:proteasome lid subunit RPN8/RPN11